MAGYDINAIKAALTTKTGADGGGKLNYWKPTIGEHEVRFLPYSDSTGKPFQEVMYYEKLSDRRVVAPSTFGLQDVIKEQFEIHRKTKEGWEIAKNLRPRERYYAVLIVRGEEAKGPQVWEFSKEIRDSIFNILTHKDNADEDMFSPETGYDFTLNITQAIKDGKPNTFNGFPVKNIVPTARKKPSKLSAKPGEAKKWLDSMPKLEEFFKSQVKSSEELLELCEAFAVKCVTGGTGSSKTPEGTDHTSGHGVTTSEPASAAEKKLADMFSGIGAT